MQLTGNLSGSGKLASRSPSHSRAGAEEGEEEQERRIVEKRPVNNTSSDDVGDQVDVVQSELQNANSWPRLYTFFFTYYFCQGIFMGWDASFSAIYLEDCGVSLSSIGFAQALTSLPFVLKIGLAILSDRWAIGRFGNRRPYALIGNTISAVSMLAVVFVQPDTHWALYVTLMFAAYLGMSTSDIAVDGMSVDCNQPNKSGHVQAVMGSGRALGMVVCALLGGVLTDGGEYKGLLLLIAAVELAFVPSLWFVREEKKADTTFEWGAFRQFKEVRIIALTVHTLVVGFGMGSVALLIRPFMVDEFDIGEFESSMFAVVMSSGFLVGALIAGYFMNRVRRNMLELVIVLVATPTAALVAIIREKPAFWPLNLVAGVVGAAAFAVLMSLSMDMADRRTAASFVTIQTAVSNLAQALGKITGGNVADNSGYTAAFLVGAGGILLSAVFLPWVRAGSGQTDHYAPPAQVSKKEQAAVGVAPAREGDIEDPMPN